MSARRVVVVTPVYRNADTLGELVRRITAVGDTAGWDWSLRLIVDASPDDSLAVAHALAVADRRLAVTALAVNVGQNAALLHGLATAGEATAGDATAGEATGGDATAFVCLDADLQDPPEAMPALVGGLGGSAGVGMVFAGRRGAYEGRVRLLTGRCHRSVMGRITGLPGDAGAFVAMDDRARQALLALDPPGLVAGLGATGVAATSVPVIRSPRPTGRSSWTAPARLRHSGRTVAWAFRSRGQGGAS